MRAEMEDALPRFVLADFFEFAQTAGTFDFVYDSGFVPLYPADRLGAVSRRAVAGDAARLVFPDAGRRARRADRRAPPPVTKRQLYSELGRLFEVVRLEPIRMPSPILKDGYPAWSCLMQRPVVK